MQDLSNCLAYSGSNSSVCPGDCLHTEVVYCDMKCTTHQHATLGGGGQHCTSVRQKLARVLYAKFKNLHTAEEISVFLVIYILNIKINERFQSKILGLEVSSEISPLC